MEETIIYFKCRKISAKTSTNRHRFHLRKEPLCLKQIEIFDTNFLVVEIPFFYKEVNLWKKEKVEKVIRTLVGRVQKEMTILICDIWYEPPLMGQLQYKHGNYTLSFLIGIYKAYPGTEQVILRGGEDAFSFIEEIYGELNALTIYTKDEEKWEEFIEEAYVQSGLIVQCNQYIGKKEDRRTCFFDFEESEFHAYRNIPAHAVYIDFAPNKQKRRVIEAKRKDIEYCTYAKFLDTCAADRVY